MKTSVINYSMSRQKGLRFDASFYLSDGLTARRKVESSPYGIFTIKDVSINIFMVIGQNVYMLQNLNMGFHF